MTVQVLKKRGRRAQVRFLEGGRRAPKPRSNGPKPPPDEPVPPGKPKNPPVKEPPRPGRNPGRDVPDPTPIDDPRPSKPKKQVSLYETQTLVGAVRRRVRARADPARGVLLHAAFFIGSAALCRRLHALGEDERAAIEMTGVLIRRCS